MSQPFPRASVVVVADGPWEETLRCLAAVTRGAGGVAHQVVVVDDGTADETRLALPRLQGVLALRGDQPQGFGAAANAGVEAAAAPLVVLLHADAVPHPGWLEPLVRLAERDAEASAVASRLLAPSGLVASDGVTFASAPYPMTPLPVGAGEPGVPSLEVSQVPAAWAVSLLVRRERWVAAGGVDVGFAGPAADLDLCLRLGARGGRILVARESAVVHHARCRGEISDADAVQLARRWLGRLPPLDPTAAGGAAASLPT